MKVLDRIFLSGAILLIVGVVWAFLVNGIGTKEWILLLAGAVLGIIAGMALAWVIFLNKRGRIGSDKMKLWTALIIIVLVALKATINISIPSYISTNGNGISVSVILAIGGFLLGSSVGALNRRSQKGH